MWGEISDKTKFALDDKGKFFAEATTFILTGTCLHYLVCYLNSSLSEYLFSKIGTTTGVGTVRWKKFKIEQLFVPQIAQNQEEIFNILFSRLKNNEIGIDAINEHIYKACNLSNDEILFIENYATSI